VIKSADWIIDLGPEGGDAGGELVAEGTPEEVAANPRSYTGQFLQAVLPGAMESCGWPVPGLVPDGEGHGPRVGVRRGSGESVG